MIKTGKVYKITNPSGKIYIGSTHRNIKTRFAEYRRLSCKSQTKIYNSLKKYGPDSHIFEIVWEGELIYMYKMERLFGEKFDVLNEEKGLNLYLPGYDDKPILMSETSRLKNSNSKKGEKHWAFGKKLCDKTKEKMKIAHKGKNISEEHKQNISKAKKLLYQNKENHPNYKKEMSQETKKKISEALKGKKKSQKHTENMSKSHMNKKLSDEHKKKISNSISGEKHPFYGKKHTEETKIKMRNKKIKHS